MVVVAILDVIFVKYYGTAVYRMLNLVHLPNFVQIHLIASELYVINQIQNSGRRHIEFITIANFGYTPISCNDWLHSCKITLI